MSLPPSISYFASVGVLCGVDRELELAVVDLELARDRLPFLFAGRQALLQADLGRAERLDQPLAFVVIVVVVPKDGIVAGQAYYGRQANDCRANGRSGYQLSPSHFDLHRLTGSPPLVLEVSF